MTEVNSLLLIPMSALAMWMTALYIESKFNFRAPNTQKNLKTDASLWKSFVFRNNQFLRNFGLFGCWILSNLMHSFHNELSDEIKFTLIALWIVSIVLYILALSWDTIISDRDYE